MAGHGPTPSHQPVPERGRLVPFSLLPKALALATLVLTAWAVRSAPPALPLDDAYITLHSATALLAGFDASYRSPVLSGITSAPHLLLVTLAQVAVPGEAGVLLVAWLAFALYAAALVRLAGVCAVRVEWQAALVVCGLTVGSFLPYQALNGLETALAMAALAWALALSSPAASSRARRRLLPVLLGTLPFLRPELAIFSAAVFALELGQAARAPERAAALRRWGGAAGLALLAASPWAFWYWRSTGIPWPTSALAKSAFQAAACHSAAQRAGAVWGGLMENLPGIAALGACFLPLSGLGWAGGFTFAAFLVGAFHFFPIATEMQEGRYTMLFAPLLVYGFALGLRSKRPLLRRAAGLLLLAGTAFNLLRLPASVATYKESCAFTRGELADLGAWMRGHLPAEARVLVHDAGYVAFATPFQLEDVVGLKSPRNAALHRALTWPSCGARRGDVVATIAGAARATHLVTLAVWEQRYGFTRALAEHGWHITTLRDGHTGYSVYRLETPRGVAGSGVATLTTR